MIGRKGGDGAADVQNNTDLQIKTFAIFTKADTKVSLMIMMIFVMLI